MKKKKSTVAAAAVAVADVTRSLKSLVQTLLRSDARISLSSLSTVTTHTHTQTHTQDETLSSLTDWRTGLKSLINTNSRVAYRTRQTPPLPEPPPLRLAVAAAVAGSSCSNKLDSFPHKRE